jgi:hypothetical protein
MPVAERPTHSLDGDGFSVLEKDLSCLDRVNGCSVTGGDVDAEMEAVRMAISIAWVVQVSPDRMLAIERFEGPAVRRTDLALVAEDASLSEMGT